MDRYRRRLENPTIRFGMHNGPQSVSGGEEPTPEPIPGVNFVTHNGETVTVDGEPVTVPV